MTNRFTNTNADNAIIEGLTRFEGFYENIYKDPFIGGTAFIFLTKPLLFIDPFKGTTAENGKMAYMNMTRDPLFTQYLVDQVMNPADRKIVEMLSYNTQYSKSNFLPLFTNESKGFDTMDVSMEQNDSFETKQGFRETLPTHKTQSEGANTFSIQLTEDSNLSFTKLLTLWVNYISNITDGTFDANPAMVMDGALDYMSSLFYFVLGPDGKTLKYWSKYTGCWPNTIPFSTMKYSKGQQDITEIIATFVYNVKEDMNPKILEEFNMLSLGLVNGNSSILKSKTYFNEISQEYSSIKESPLLNLNALKQLNLASINSKLTAIERDPLILYVPGNDKGILEDSGTNNHFELIFDDYAYKSNYLNDIMHDQTYINDTGTNFLKNQQYENSKWNQTDYWAEEQIL